MGKMVVVDAPLVLAGLSASATGAGAGIGLPVLFVAMDRLTSDLAAATSGGTVERPTITSRLLAEEGVGPIQSEAIEQGILLFAGAAAPKTGGVPRSGTLVSEADPNAVLRNLTPGEQADLVRFLQKQGGTAIAENASGAPLSTVTCICRQRSSD
jgi:hypothetical protein